MAPPSATDRGSQPAEPGEINSARAPKAGASRVIVKTETFNGRALAFYKGKGFAESGVVTEEVGGKSVELSLLSLDLTSQPP